VKETLINCARKNHIYSRHVFSKIMKILENKNNVLTLMMEKDILCTTYH
jgi:hypothetical protein